MTEQDLDRLRAGSYLGRLDEHFAGLLARLDGGDFSPELFLAAALAARSTGQGNTCLDLQGLAGRTLEDEEGRPLLACPELDDWRLELEKSPVVGSPGEFKPLILDSKSRLYLHRYREYEETVGDSVRELAGLEAEDFDESRFAGSLARLFPQPEPDPRDRQRIAAACALTGKFLVISGGPGTGKTTTVAKVLALLLEQPGGTRLRVALCAPTGKAAARLQQAIRLARETLDCTPEAGRAIPDEAFTIHRLLGFRPDSSSCRYGPGNRLPYDIVVVDEASMVDLALAVRLVGALQPGARLILVGDRDQLSSVEAGSVLGDICGDAEVPGFTEEHVRRLGGAAALELEQLQRPRRPVAACVVQLNRSFRFGSQSGIGQLSRAVNCGDSRRALALLTSGDYPDISFCGAARPEALARSAGTRLVEGFREYLAAADHSRAHELFGSFRVLCPLRRGPYGVEALNALAERMLAGEGLIRPGERWYVRRPVLINRNDYGLGLYNGDVGLTLPEEDGELRVSFPGPDNTLRKFLPGRLPEHETVYAMTVHKSQGSEFDNVLLVLPENDSPLLTRELIYTAVTRARQRVEVLGSESVFLAAVSRRIARTSGLRDALWGDSS
ncbi:MAG: exodeoxyribonuclease V subunit alpha [Candidatus Glassbacteria bacterium]|nr:exodeoxyribonuclease V subunit alpha [Candidatus Glassbacteria bacterium]